MSSRQSDNLERGQAIGALATSTEHCIESAFGAMLLTTRGATLLKGTLQKIEVDGTLVVLTPGGDSVRCDVLHTLATPCIEVGCSVIFAIGVGGDRGVVLGSIGRLGGAGAERIVKIEAASSLTLSCGLSSIDLRADGKVMIKGEDVTVRAKGTQRIRAGTVSIN